MKIYFIIFHNRNKIYILTIKIYIRSIQIEYNFIIHTTKTKCFFFSCMRFVLFFVSAVKNDDWDKPKKQLNLVSPVTCQRYLLCSLAAYIYVFFSIERPLFSTSTLYTYRKVKKNNRRKTTRQLFSIWKCFIFLTNNFLKHETFSKQYFLITHTCRYIRLLFITLNTL